MVLYYAGKRKGVIIVGLFDLFKKPKKNTFGQRLDRLTEEGELPFGWIYANLEFTQKIESERRVFADAYFSSKGKGILKEYAALKSLILYMKDVKRICDSKGECFSLWSTFHVSNPHDLASFEERLKYIEENIDSLLKTESLIAKLRTELPKLIKAEPGILQTDIYKRYDADAKTHIRDTLWILANDGIITREKSGRTYSLKIKGG